MAWRPIVDALKAQPAAIWDPFKEAVSTATVSASHPQQRDLNRLSHLGVKDQVAVQIGEIVDRLSSEGHEQVAAFTYPGIGGDQAGAVRWAAQHDVDDVGPVGLWDVVDVQLVQRDLAIKTGAHVGVDIRAALDQAGRDSPDRGARAMKG